MKLTNGPPTVQRGTKTDMVGVAEVVWRIQSDKRF